MITMKIIGSVFHLTVQLVLLPAQIVLTMLICMMNFAGGVFDFIFGLIGGFIILAGLSCLFMSPVEWSLVIEAMVAGMVIGSFPRMIRYFDWIKGISGENIKLEIHRLWQPRIPAVDGILKYASIAKYDTLLEEDK